MSTRPISKQEKGKGVLKIAIGKYLHRVAAWLLKRFPDGKNKFLFRDKYLFGIRFYFFFRIGFQPDPKLKHSEQGIGLQPAVFIRAEDTHVTYHGKPRKV